MNPVFNTALSIGSRHIWYCSVCLKHIRFQWGLLGSN